MKHILLLIAVLAAFSFSAFAQQGMGVGNANPQEMLDVSGAIKIGTDLTNTTGAPSGGAGTVRFRAGTFEGWDGTAWTPLGGGSGADSDWTVSGVNQYSGVSGNVGIGTTTPNYKLDVSGSARFNNGSFVNNGLAANPSISFSSDSNTGIYAPSADNLGFVTGGSEGFRVDENGNVGMGPVNPDAKLDLVGSFRYTDGNQGVNKVLRSDGSGFATWVDPTTLISNDGDWTISGNNQYSTVTGNVGIGETNPVFKLDVGHPGANQQLRIRGNWISNHANNARANFIDWNFGVGAGRSGSAGDATVMWSFNGAGRGILFASTSNGLSQHFGQMQHNMYIAGSSGNVGIGNTSPTAKLEVSGQVKITGGTPGANKVLTSDATGLASWLDPNTIISNDGDWTVSGNNQYSAVSGNVGIGLTNPSAPLHIKKDQNGQTSLIIENDNTSGNSAERISFNNEDGGIAGISVHDNDNGAYPSQMRIFNNRPSSSVHLINSGNPADNSNLSLIDGGNVGIGTLTPDAKLEVNGQVKITGGTPGANKVLTSDAAGLATWVDPTTLVSGDNLGDHTATENILLSDFYISNDGDDEGIRIDDNGNVGVGTSAPVHQLHIQSNTSGLNLPVFLRNSSVNSGDGVGIGFVSEPNGDWTKASVYYERTSNFGVGKLHFLVDDGLDNQSVTLSETRMTITPQGNVGIGITAPTAKLDVVGGVHSSNVGFGQIGDDGVQNFANYGGDRHASITIGQNFYSNNGVLRIAKNHVSLSGVGIHMPGNQLTGQGSMYFFTNPTGNVTAGTDIGGLASANMVLTSDGNLGVGNTNPAAKLDIAGDAALNDNQLRLREGTDSNHFLAHLGGSFDGPLLQGLSTVVLKTGVNGDASGVFLRNNRVGIGIANPTNGLLHVDGFRDVNFGYQYFNSGAGTGWCGGCNSPISIWAQHRIATSELNVFSDARIKDVIGVSDRSEDLSTLLDIQVTDYTYKDKIGRGTAVFKKVVAQQLEEVYPVAVSKTTNTIPDIYQLATIIDGVLSLPEVELEKGEKLKLITDNGSEEMVTVEAIDENGVLTSTDFTGNVFVYGREVDDFRTVDYEAISMLNVSATQELFKMILNLQDENANLKASVDSLADLRAEIEKLKEWTQFEQQTTK